MNERIKELMEQTGVPLSMPFDKWCEKFAELIVQDCVKFCVHESNDDEHDEYDMGMWVKAESIKTAIVEHFGVK